MADKGAERIRYQSEVLRNLLILTIAIGGGTLSLILGPLPPLRLALAVAGIVATIVLLVALWHQHTYIKQLIEQLPEEK